MAILKSDKSIMIDTDLFMAIVQELFFKRSQSGVYRSPSNRFGETLPNEYEFKCLNKF